jgi:predicted Zn-dependent protease
MVAGCLAANAPLTGDHYGPDKTEMRLQRHSNEMQRLVNESGLVYRDPTLQRYLDQIVVKLLPPEVLKRFPFKVLIVKNPYFQGFALPDCVICLHTGLLARLENEAQLAFLLAHEMTHCTHSHALRTLRHIDTEVVDTGDTSESSQDKRLLTLFGTTGSLARIRRYTQELETEADLVGLRLIMKAGYDPNHALGLLEFAGTELDESNGGGRLASENSRDIHRRLEICRNHLDNGHRVKKVAKQNQEVFFLNLQKVILDNTLLDLRAGRFDSAERNLGKYLTLKPDDSRAHYLLGEVFRQRSEEGDKEKSKAHYKKAMLLDPYYPDPHRGIGLIHYKSGDKALSRDHFESYLALSPQATDIAYIRGYLEKCEK